MKVKELIAKLKEFPGDLEVVSFGDSEWDPEFSGVSDVERKFRHPTNDKGKFAYCPVVTGVCLTCVELVVLE